MRVVHCKRESSPTNMVDLVWQTFFQSFLSLVVQDIMKAAVEPCVALIQECNAGSVVSIEACLGAYIVCNYGEQVPYTHSGYNPYDMRLKCEVPPLCYDFGNIDKFLNR